MTAGPYLFIITPMIEITFLLFGLAFSIMVYYLSIRPRDLRPAVKALYFSITAFGITGMLFLIGIMISHALSGFRTP